MRAHAAAAVVMLHHAHADAGLFFRYAGADRRDHAARLMAGDEGAAHLAEPERGSAAGRAVELQIASAHARSLDLQHDLPGTRRRVGKLQDLELALAAKHDAFHAFSLPVSGMVHASLYCNLL